jgi:DNA-binding winged helix-turn-helix (wHTH) protein
MRTDFGDFTLDRDTRQLLRGERELPLEPKAFELLELLLSCRPRALSKAAIRDRLWPRTFVSESTLSGLVVDLRAALGDAARRPLYLRTVRGFGYAFCGDAADAGGDSRPDRRGPRLRLFWGEREIPLGQGENVLGRVEGAAAWIDSPTVSRRHARILVSGSRATLEDLGSKNGTFLRGERIDAPARLADGDEVRFGHVRMTFRVFPGGASTATAGAP